jgi:ferredoxin-type protein NapH
MAGGPSDSILPQPGVFVATAATATAAWSLAAWLWSSGSRAFAVSLVLAGLSLGPCVTGYVTAPRALKQQQRRVVLFTGGLSILAPSLLAGTSLDLEGFFALLLAGVGGAAIGHTLVTVIAGPLVFGRVLCGWGCWRAMVLELLPVGRGGGRRRGAWAALPYVGLATSAGSAALGYVLLRHRPGGSGAPEAGLTPVLVACGVYYVASIGLALALGDQRAFCKYLCPSSAILRWTSRPALLRVRARPEGCNGCGACTRTCPMDVDVAMLAATGRRIGPGDCILCQRCVQACPTGALRLAFSRSRDPAELRPSLNPGRHDADSGRTSQRGDAGRGLRIARTVHSNSSWNDKRLRASSDSYG